MSFKTQADEFYQANYAGRGIAPRHVAALKERLAKAFRKGEKPGAAARAFFKEKEITLTEKEDTATTTTTKPNKKETTIEKTTKTETAPRKKVVALPTVEPVKMDRKSLKATIATLKSAGVDIAFDKADDDGTLTRKVNAALAALPSPEMLSKLESIDPSKLAEAAADCFGLFVDLRSASCQVCADQTACIKQYITNLKGDFAAFDAAMTEIKTEAAAAALTETDIKDTMKKKKTDTEPTTTTTTKKASAKAAPIKWEPKRRVFVMDVPNPGSEDEDVVSTLDIILTEVPSTMKEVYDIVDRVWTYEDKEAFVKDWIISMRELGVLKLESDLTPEERDMLTEAGVL